MSTINESSRLAWLAAVWSDQRHKISRLLGRIADLGAAGVMKPKVFAKFLRLLTQVAAAKDEEVRILSEIEAIEKKHRFQRKQGFLKRVGAEDKAGVAFKNEHKDFQGDNECEHLVVETASPMGAEGLHGRSTYEEEECARPLTGMAWLANAQKLHGMITAAQAAGPVTEKSSNWFIWLAIFWFLMARPAITPKSQSLTVD